MELNIAKLFRISFCGLLILSLSLVAFAQFKAGIQGTISDSSDASVAGANVVLTNTETNQSQTIISNESGFYRFSSLAPGNYKITVEKAGFKKKNVEKITINAEQLQGYNVTLEAGGISESVTVTADEAQLQTEDANIRKTITNAEILSLPQSGRDPYELARLSPGVFGSGSRGSGGASQGLPNTSGPGGSFNSIFATENVQPISANGQRVSSNNYQIDGTSVNSQTWGGGAVITPSQESVKEVLVTATTYSAEDGRNSGAQIKVISNSGTNSWHGSGFYKVADPRLNAFNKMPQFVGTQDTGGAKRVERKYNTYGGSFGGRIIRDRLFFFATYEGLKENTSAKYNSLVETSAFRSSIIAARPNTVTSRILSAAGVAPRVLRTLNPTCSGIAANPLPAPNNTPWCTVVGTGMDIGSITGTYGSYVRTLRDPALPNAQPIGGGLDGIADVQWAELERISKFRGNQFQTRIDYKVSEKDNLTFSSYFVPNKATASNDGAQSRPQADINSERLSYAIGAIYNRTISATSINEARFNITRWGFDETKSNPDAALNLPRIEIEGFFSDRLRFGFPQGQNTPGIISEKQLDFRDTFTTIFGNHVLKVGGEYRRDLNSNGEVGASRPLYSFHRLWNFANGTPIFESITADSTGKPSANNTKFNTSELAFFVQDDWKIRTNLTLNLGLRWDYMSPIVASDGGVLGNLLLDSNNSLAGAKITTAKSLYKKDLTNFGPQIGFAWNPKMLDSKLVVRGGGGIGYDRLPNALLNNARRNPPNGQNFGICCGTDVTEFGSPFVGGQITFVTSTDNTIFGYPRNPGLGGGTNPANGLPNVGGIEIYGTPQDLPSAYVMRYSLEGQYQLPKNLFASLSYSGAQGRHFVRILPLQIMVATNPNINAAYFASPDVNTSFNAMVARLQGRFLNQFSFDTNYRWSKSLDTVSFEGPTAQTNQSFPVDQREERGPSDFDVRQAFIFAGTWDLPIFRNKSSLAGKLAGGWQISSIASWNSGFPWTPKLFGCLAGNTSNSSNFCDPRPTSFNGTQPRSNSNENFLSANGVFGLSQTALFGTAGTVFGVAPPFNAPPFANKPGIGRNRFVGPKYFAMDMTFAKKFKLGNWGFIGENANIDVRFNFFNILNNLNLSPINSLSDQTRVQSANFGRITSALAGRTGEFQIRFSF
jgi:Carboxypeptidase regulatory-like domain